MRQIHHYKIGNRRRRQADRGPGERWYAHPPRCEHYDCQRWRAAELAAMGRLDDAIRCVREPVPCRRTRS